MLHVGGDYQSHDADSQRGRNAASRHGRVNRLPGRGFSRRVVDQIVGHDARETAGQRPAVVMAAQTATAKGSSMPNTAMTPFALSPNQASAIALKTK